MCVDDFGLHAGVDAAALRLVELQRAHAIGCLVGGPSWAAGGAPLRRLGADNIDIGLHLDLTDQPLLRRSRRSLAAWIAASALHRVDRRALRAEIGAQLTAFEQTVGRAPAFVDGHQHVHQLPVVRGLLVDELVHRYGGAPPWLRSTRRPRTAPGLAWHDAFKPWLIESLGAAALTALARRNGIAQNRHLLGVYDFRGGVGRYRALLSIWLRCAGDGDLLMCHAGLPAHAADALARARQAEFEVLAGTAFGELLVAARVALRPMSRILAEIGAADCGARVA